MTAKPRHPLNSSVAHWFAQTLLNENKAWWKDAGGDTQTTSLAEMACTLEATDCPDRDSGRFALFGRLTQSPSESEVHTSNTTVSGHKLTVLIAGPGMGKSTTSTLIAQILREQWLTEESLPSSASSDQASQLSKVRTDLTGLNKREGIVAPLCVVPLRIELPEYLRWAAGNTVTDDMEGLWQFLEHKLVGVIQRPATLTTTSLKNELLLSAPLYWIFDAYDEVPLDQRPRVEKFIGATARDTSVLRTLVTTRPVVYGQPWGEQVAEYIIAPLDVERSVEFVTRMLTAFGMEGDSLAVVVARLQSAKEQPHIVELLTTPLHASMIAFMLFAQGEIPSSPWDLFEDYVDKVFDREERKPSAEAFRKNAGLTAKRARDVLKLLHDQMGLAMHVRAQGGADANAYMPEHHVTHYLRDILQTNVGLSPATVDHASAPLLRMTDERLGLLFRFPDAGYTFRLRSLQEFFAARALLNADVPTQQQRIEAIAFDRHWQNVMRFVACKLSAELSSGSIVVSLPTICDRFNDGTHGSVAKGMRAGSVLAAQILRATNDVSLPRVREELLDRALDKIYGSISWPSQPLGHEFARMSDPRDKDAAVESDGGRQLIKRVEQSLRARKERYGTRAAIRTFRTLTGYPELDLPNLADELTRSGLAEGLSLEVLIEVAGTQRAVLPVMKELSCRHDPRVTRWCFQSQHWREHVLSDPCTDWLPWTDWERNRKPRIDRGVSQILRVLLTPISRRDLSLDKRSAPNSIAEEACGVVKSLTQFESAPTRFSLVQWIRSGSWERINSDCRYMVREASWVALGVFNWMQNDADRLECIAWVESGSAGDTADWHAAEKRWRDHVRVPPLEVVAWRMRGVRGGLTSARRERHSSEGSTGSGVAWSKWRTSQT